MSLIDFGETGIFDLDGQTIELEDNFICNGTALFTNGKIECKNNCIVVSGADADVTFGEGLIINSEGTAISVEKRGKAVIDSAKINSNATAIKVTGFSLAKDNSTLTVKSGEINANSDLAIEVEKGGSLIVESGSISSTGNYAISVDGPRSKADLSENNISIISTNGAEILNEAKEEPAQVVAETPEEILNDVVEQLEATVEEIEAAPELDEPEVEKVDEPQAEDVRGHVEPMEVDIEVVIEEPVQPSALSSTSIVLTKPTFVYGAPSTKICIATTRGPVKILDEVNGYLKVSFKAPGSGKVLTGYIKGDK